MKPPFRLTGSLLAVALTCVFSHGHAQDATPPVVLAPVKDMMVAPNTAPVTVSLENVFGLRGVVGPMVRVTTNAGKIDVELFKEAAPDTVANFLKYVDAGSYTDAVFQKVKRNASGTNVILLGGEFAITDGTVDFITTFGNVDNEYSLPNTPGTIAMFKQSSKSPDSAADQFYFNVTDNSAKFGPAINGGNTVFGRVIESGMARIAGIAGLKTYDLTSILGSKFNKTPLYNYDPSQTVAANNLVVATSIAELPLISQGPGAAGALKVTVAGNTNPTIATAEISGSLLIVRPVAGKIGSTTVTLQAKDQAKTKLTTTFNVTVR